MKTVRHTVGVLALLLLAQSIQALTLNITSPRNGARFESCATITVQAEFDIPEADVRRVYFYQNGQSLRSVRQAPWEYTWENVPDGIYEIHAKLTTQSGESIETDSLQVFVGPIADGDKIINGEFSCGTAPWNLAVNAEASAELIIDEEGWLSDEPSMAYIDITNPGTANWHVMLTQPCPIDSGHTYQVYFLAEVENMKSVGVDFQSTTGDYPVHFWQSVDVTSDSYEYGPIEFFCPVTDHSNEFKLAVSSEAAGIYLDAIKVIDLNWVKNETRVDGKTAAPTTATLMQNYPNPFNPSTEIQFELQKTGHTRLAIYNLQGQLVRSCFNGLREAGLHTFTWDGRDSTGQPAPSGIYIYQLETEDFQSAKRMLLIR